MHAPFTTKRFPSDNELDLNVTGVIEELERVKSENVDLRTDVNNLQTDVNNLQTQLNTVMTLLQQTVNDLSKFLPSSFPFLSPKMTLQWSHLFHYFYGILF